MKKFIQNNQKKLIALFSALLMIMFMLPANRGASGSQPRVIGKLAGKSVYYTDIAQAKQDWDILGRAEWSQYGQILNMRMELQEPAELAIDANPTAFYLLDVEARQEGIEVSDDEVNSFLVNRKVTSPDDQAAVVQAVERLMRVEALIDRAAGAVRVSQPQVRRALATDAQQVWLNVVEFPADNFHPTTAPTTQQADDQYNRFANQQPGHFNAQAGDPYGFGYTDPDRIKYQYIEIPHAQIVESVKQQIPPIQWAADEITYRRAHQDEFPNPTTIPVSAGSTTVPVPVELAWPSTQPFDDVNMPIFKRLSQEKVDDLTQQLRTRITTTMAADYTAWLDAKNKNSPTPLSSVDVPYDSPDYLGALKAAIEKDTPNFSATVAVLSEFGKTQKDLEDEPGIGRAVTASPEIPFAEYLMTSAAPLQTSADTAASTLQVMAPSVPLTDADGNIYICRFTEADKASRQHMSIVMDQVVRDAQTLQSMDMAHSAAQSLVDAVRLSGDLAKSAADFNRKLLVAGPVVPTQSATISDYPLKPESNQILMDQLRTMLLSPGMAGANLPISVVDLPPDRKVVVVQFNTIVPGWTANSLAGKTAAAQDDLMQNSLRPFLIDWCNIDAVSKRLDYEPLVAP